MQVLNCTSEKYVLRCQILDSETYWKKHDIFMVCNTMSEIGKNAWYIRRKKLAPDERGYFTFRKVLLA